MSGGREIERRTVAHWWRLFSERTDVDLASMVVLQTALDEHPDLDDAGLGGLTRAVLLERALALKSRLPLHHGETVAAEQ